MVPHYANSDIIGLLFCGAIGFLCFFVTFLYLRNKELIYAYYALFLLFILLYGFINLKADTWLNDLLNGYLQNNKKLIEPITILSFSFYIFFTIELIEIKAQNKWIYRTLRIWGIACISYAILYFLIFPIISEYTLTIFILARIFIFSMSTVLITGIIRKISSPVKPEFIIGSIAYFAGSIVASMRFIIHDLPFPSFYQFSAPNYFEFGILIETTFFALALGKRIAHSNNERQKTKEELIAQMLANDRLIKEMNKKLAIEIKDREKEILHKQEQINQQEMLMMQAEFEKKFTQSEMLVRRMQINPHFIFNCLNSIKYLIQSDQNKKATTYLLIFSRFIREVLETSQHNIITLKRELDITEKYLQLEKNRFNDDFTYEIQIKDHRLLQQLFIPPLLLQPFVENAIWHGLLLSTKSEKLLHINLEFKSDRLIILIDDNGIGRKNSMLKNENKLTKSMGIALTEERIKLFNYYYNHQLCFKIIDKTDSDGEVIGTRVALELLFHDINLSLSRNPIH